MNLHSMGAGTIEARKPNIFAASVSPVDENGNVYLSFDLQGSLEWLETADTVIFEINDQMSYTKESQFFSRINQPQARKN